MAIKNAEPINPFDAEDRRIAERLNIVLPQLWITDLYEERLKIHGVSLQVNADNLIRAYDLLGVQPPRDFGVIFDSLAHDEGPETDRLYEIPKTYEQTLETLPFFRLLSDPTPTAKEESAQLADLGLLVGSWVMAELIETKTSEELEDEKTKRAENLKIGGIATHFTTAVGNIAANATHLYNLVPYVGSGLGLVVLGGGVGTRVITALKSRRLKEQELCDYADDEAEEVIQKVARDAQIISFTPTFGSSKLTSEVLEGIMQELDDIDPSVG